MEKGLLPFALENKRLNAVARSMEYKGDEPLEIWQARARDKLTELLGLPYETCAPQFEIEYRD